jgi:hypothetical protein
MDENNENIDPNSNSTPKKLAILLILVHGEMTEEKQQQTINGTIYKIASAAPCFVNLAYGEKLAELLTYWEKNVPGLFERADNNYEDMKGLFHQLVMQSQMDVMKYLSHDPFLHRYKSTLKHANVSYVNRPFESNAYYDKLFIEDTEVPSLDVVVFTKDAPPEFILRGIKTPFRASNRLGLRDPLKTVRLSQIINMLSERGYDGFLIYDTSCSVISPMNDETPREKRRFAREIVKTESKKMRLGGRKRKTRRIRKTRRRKRNGKKTRKNIQ